METWQTIQDGANTRNNRFEKKLCIGYQKNTKKIILLTLSWSLLLTLNCFIPPLEFSFHLCPSLKTFMTSRGAYQPSEIWGIICAQFSVFFLFMFTFYQVGFLHSLLIFEVFLLITRDQFKCCSYTDTCCSAKHSTAQLLIIKQQKLKCSFVLSLWWL